MMNKPIGCIINNIDKTLPVNGVNSRLGNTKFAVWASDRGNIDRFPYNRNIGCFKNLLNCSRYFGADTVSWNKGAFLSFPAVQS